MCERIRNTALFRKWETYEVDSKSYVLAGSAILLCLGIRQKISDLDIAITNPLVWTGFIDEGHQLIKSPTTAETIILLEGGKIELKDSFLETYLDIDLQNPQNIEIIGGLRFLTLECVKKYKEVLNRPKDRRDLKLIEMYEKGDK